MEEKGFQDAEQKRSITSTFDGYNKPSKNPKIQALLNEIINDSTSTTKPLPTTPNEEKVSWKQSTTVLPPPPQEVVVDVFRMKSSRDRILPPEVIIDAPRTNGDIVGYSDDGQVDGLPFRTQRGIIGYVSESSAHNHQSMEKWKFQTTKVKILPATAFGIFTRKHADSKK